MWKMWENIPPVQLHISKFFAKAHLSSSRSSQWPTAQLRHLLLMFPSVWLHFFPTLAHLGPYLLPPSSLSFLWLDRLRGRISVRVCVWVFFRSLYSGVFADVCVNKPVGGNETASGCVRLKVSVPCKKPSSVHVHEAVFLSKHTGRSEDHSPLCLSKTACDLMFLFPGSL